MPSFVAKIQAMIDQNLCKIRPGYKDQMNFVMVANKVIARQCRICLGIFSTKTSSVKLHIDICSSKILNQMPYEVQQEARESTSRKRKLDEAKKETGSVIVFSEFNNDMTLPDNIMDNETKFMMKREPESEIQQGSLSDDDAMNYNQIQNADSPSTSQSLLYNFESFSERFNTTKRREIQAMIDQNLCTVRQGNESQMNFVMIGDKVIARQCQICFGLFSTKTSCFKLHTEICSSKTSSQIPYLLRQEEQKEFDMMMVDLIAMDSRSFSMAETDAFKNVIDYCIQLGYKIGKKADFTPPENMVPSRSSIHDTLREEVGQVIEPFKAFLRGIQNFRCAIVLDFSISKYKSLGVSIHFIHDWKLKIIHLSLIDLSQIQSTSADIPEMVNDKLQAYGIGWKNNFVVTGEGTNVSEHFCSDLTSLCILQTLNTVVKRTTDPFKTTGRNVVNVTLDDQTKKVMERCNDHIEKLKRLAAFIKTSKEIWATIKDSLATVGETRWLSNLRMIEWFNNLSGTEKAWLINCYNNADGRSVKFTVFVDAKEDFQDYVTVMGKFSTILQLLESESTPTINHVLLSFYNLEDHLEGHKKSPNNFISALATSCSAVLEAKRSNFTHPVHYAACILDIFQRSQILQLRNREEMTKAKECTKNMLQSFIRNLNLGNTDEQHEYDEFAVDPDDFLSSQEQSQLTNAVNELESYYRCRPTPEQIKKKDVLQFWNSVALQFPLLSKFANFIFSIPACSSSTQRIDSSLTNAAPSDGRSLDLPILEDLLLYKSIKKSELFFSTFEESDLINSVVDYTPDVNNNIEPLKWKASNASICKKLKDYEKKSARLLGLADFIRNVDISLTRYRNNLVTAESQEEIETITRKIERYEKRRDNMVLQQRLNNCMRRCDINGKHVSKEHLIEKFESAEYHNKTWQAIKVAHNDEKFWYRLLNEDDNNSEWNYYFNTDMAYITNHYLSD